MSGGKYLYLWLGSAKLLIFMCWPFLLGRRSVVVSVSCCTVSCTVRKWYPLHQSKFHTRAVEGSPECRAVGKRKALLRWGRISGRLCYLLLLVCLLFLRILWNTDLSSRLAGLVFILNHLTHRGSARSEVCKICRMTKIDELLKLIITSVSAENPLKFSVQT